MYKCEDICPTGQFDGCCVECGLKENCSDKCPENPSECGISIIINEQEAIEEGLQVFATSQLTVLQEIASVVKAKDALEEQEKNLKKQLKAAMEKSNIKKFESDVLNLTYVAATNATSADSKKLKEKYPDIFAECSKTSAKAAYVKITVK